MTPSIELRPGPPAWALAAAAPVVAIALVAYRAAGPGLTRTADDPVSPWFVVAGTAVLAVWVSWRALTQRADLTPDALRCRNLSSTFEIDWDGVESLQVVRRPGVVVIDIRFVRMRRTHRLGAATRFPGPDAEAVLDTLRAHPMAAALLVERGS